MDIMDAPKITSMSNDGNYYYNVMTFWLKNTDVIYQRLVDNIFSKEIRWNLKTYIDDMTVKTSEKETNM